MFNKDSKDIKVPTNFNTVIGATTTFEGTITVSGNIKIDGTVKGNIAVTNGDIFIGKSGKIVGDVNANNVFISGDLTGNVTKAELVHIDSTGKINGDIEVGKIISAEGAIFNGKCSMKVPTTENKK